MNELREIKNAIRKYEELLDKDQENAKKYCDHYYNEIELQKEVCDIYIDITSQTFEKWGKACVYNFFSEESNIVLKMKKRINSLIINYYLNKLSLELERTGTCLEKLEIIQIRFNQYRYLQNNNSGI